MAALVAQQRPTEALDDISALLAEAGAVITLLIGVGGLDLPEVHALHGAKRLIEEAAARSEAIYKPVCAAFRA